MTEIQNGGRTSSKSGYMSILGSGKPLISKDSQKKISAKRQKMATQ